jgi:ribosome recycling factor
MPMARITAISSMQNHNAGIAQGKQMILAGTSVREYHVSAYLCKKKGGGKGGKKKGKDDSDDEGDGDGDGEPVTLPEMSTFSEKMDHRIQVLKENLSKIIGTRASADMLNHILIDFGGSKVSIKDVAQITLKNPTEITCAVYDPELVNSINQNILNSGQGFLPSVQGSNVVVGIPKPSQESRKASVKSASAMAEKSKLEIRNIRKQGVDATKKLKGKVADDDVKRWNKELEGVTEKKVNQVEKLAKEKEEELMK